MTFGCIHGLPSVAAGLARGLLSIVAVAVGMALTGCAAWHDLFQRDQPDPVALTEALSVPTPAATDVAVVLGCPSEDDGRPSPCLQCRVRAAQQVLVQGRVQALIFSGGAAHNRHVEAEVMARLAQRRGVGRERVLLEGQSLTTWQNLRYSQRIMQAHGFRSALLISTRDHLPRARRFAAYYGIPVALFACEDAAASEVASRASPSARQH